MPLVKRVILVLLLGGLVVLSYVVLRLFLVPVAWATILAYVTWPAYRRLRSLLRGNVTGSALLMTVILTAAFVLPVVWLIMLLRGELGAASTIVGMKRTALLHNAPANDAISYAGHRFPPDVISYAVWLYYRFPLSLRMVEELLAARGIELTYETVRRWSVKFGLGIARRIRSTALERGDKWHLDEAVVTINGKKYWLWRAVDQHGAVLDVLVQSRRDRHAAKRLMRKLLKKHGRALRVLITNNLKSYAAANRDLGLNVEHRQHKGLNNRAENSHQPTRVREKVMRRFKSARHRQRFTSVHDQVANLFMHCRYNVKAQDKRQARTQAFEAWETVTGNSMLDRLAA